MTNALKKVLSRTLLATAFAVAAASPVMAQSADRGPNGDQQYSQVTQKMRGLEDIAQQIQQTQHSAETLGVPVDKAAIAAMKAELKKGADETAPQIILMSGLSARDVQGLINEYSAKIGPLPGYLAKVNGKPQFVSVCREQLLVEDGNYTVAVANDVGNCVAEKRSVDPNVVAPGKAPAPIAQPVVEQPVETPKPVAAKPVTLPPAPVQTVPAPLPQQPVNPPAQLESAKSGLPMIDYEIGGGGLLIVLAGAFGIAKMRKKKSPAPAEEPVAAKAPDAPPPPPSFVTRAQDDTPPKPAKKFDI